MFLLLFGFWLILNGNITAEIVIVGLVLSLLIYLFCWKFLSYSPVKELRLLLKVPLAFSYLIWLVGQIFASAFATMRLIWSPTLRV